MGVGRGGFKSILAMAGTESLYAAGNRVIFRRFGSPNYRLSMNSRFLPVLALVLSPLAVALVSCGPDTPSYQGTYLPGLRPEGNEMGKGRSEDETSLVMRKDNVSYWDGDGVPGAPAITIDLSQQRAFFYKGGKLVGVALISTGTNENATPVGNFKIIQKNKDHESNLYGEYKYPDGSVAKKDVDTSRDKKPPGAIFDGTDMPYFMRFNGGVGMHTGYLPGFAASHGCVRMPHFMAQKFFENVSVGTPVQVVP
jgi:hypothetical protein